MTMSDVNESRDADANASLIPQAPGFDAPIDMLEACHERVQAQLRTLTRLVQWLPEHGADTQARQAAANVMRYFDQAAVNHHLDEEEDLLPRLLQRVDDARREALVSLVEWILADHQRLFGLWAALRVYLVAIAAGHASELPPALVSAFQDGYARHIAKEEGELLVHARALLSEADMAEIGATMTRRRTRPSGVAPDR